MGKNNQNDNSIRNIEAYILKYKLDLAKIEFSWLKLGKFTNISNKISMIEEANTDCPYEANRRFYENKFVKKYYEKLKNCGRYDAEWKTLHQYAE